MPRGPRNTTNNIHIAPLLGFIGAVSIIFLRVFWKALSNRMTWVVIGSGIILAILCVMYFSYRKKQSKRFTYPLDDTTELQIQVLDILFYPLSNMSLRYIASSIFRQQGRVKKYKPSQIDINIDIWAMEFEDTYLFFLPDKVLLLLPNTMNQCLYTDIQIEFKEKRQTGNTWRHTTVGGQPDRRYKHNPEIPIISPEAVSLLFPSGEEIYIEIPDRFAVVNFVEKWQEYCQGTNILSEEYIRVSST